MRKDEYPRLNYEQLGARRDEKDYHSRIGILHRRHLDRCPNVTGFSAVRMKRPAQPAAPGYCWVRLKGGPRDGEWIQVLRREYESK